MFVGWKQAHSMRTSRVVSLISLFLPPITPARATAFCSSAMSSMSFVRECSWPSSVGNFKRIARHRADFPRDTDNTVEVRTVWRDFEIIEYVAGRSAKEFGERLADFRVFAQDQQSVHLVGQAELLRRAHHALAEDAENPAFLDHERLLFTGLQWQRVVRQDERHFVTDLVVLRPANDGALAFAVIDFAHGELV